MGESLFGLISAGRRLIYNCTGYMGEEWHINGVKLFDAIKQSHDKADSAAKAAEKLRSANTLDPAGGMTVLRGAIAQAKAHAETAKTEAASAAKSQLELATLLRQQKKAPTELGDPGPLVTGAKTAETTALGVWDALRNAAGPSTAWHALAARLNGGLLARIETLKATPGVDSAETLLQVHGGLVTQLRTVAGKPFDAGGVDKVVQQVTAGITKLEQAIGRAETKLGGGPDQLAKLRQAALLQFRRTIEGYGLDKIVATATEKVKETVPGAEPRHLAGLIKNQAGAPARLANALENAATPEAIDAAVQEALRVYRESVAALATEVHNGSAQDRTVQHARAGMKSEEELKAFEAKQQEAEQALSELRLAGAPTYAAMRQRYDALVADTEKTRDYKEAAETSLPALIDEIEQARIDHIDATEPEIEKLKQQVHALRSQYTQAQKTPNAKLAAALLAMIGASLDEAENFLDCNGNLEAADPARGIITEVTDLLRDFTSNSSLFATLAKTLEEIKAGLAHADLKLIPPTDLAALSTRLEELQNPRNGLGPAEFKSAVEALKQDLAAQTLFGGELRQWRVTSTGQLGTATGTYNAFAQAVGRTPPTSFGGTRPDPAKGEIKLGLDALSPMLTLVVGADAFAAHKQGWTDTLKTVTDGLTLVWDGRALKDPAAVSQDAEAGTKRAEEVEAVTEAWEELTEKAKGYEALVLGAQGNIGEYKLLMQQLAALSDQIARDPEAARSQLLDLEKRLEGVRGTPNFDAAIARAIAKIPAEWGKVLDLTDTNLSSLLNAITIAATGSPFDGSLGELAKMVEDTKRRFARDAFTTIAASLGQPDPTGAQRAQRRAEREAGLRLIRQYQDQLFKDPLFLHLQRNPFGVSLFGQLFRFLDRVELEFTRAAA